MVVAAFAITPLFVTSGPLVVTGNPATDSSWDIYRPTRWAFRITLLIAVSGVVLMAIGVVRVHRSKVPPLFVIAM